MTCRYYSGAILDVSGSMQYGTGTFSDTEGGKWVRALLDAIDDLVTHDASNNDKVLAIGAGARRMENEAFDVIKTIALLQNDDWCDSNLQEATYGTITAIFNLLERHGAKHIRKWAEMNVVSSVITEDEAILVLRKLKEDRDFTRTFVFEYLPESCRDWVDENDTSVMGFFGYQFQRVQSSVVSSFRQATKDDISDVVKKAMSYLLRVRNDSAYPAHKAADILRGTDGGERLSPERAEKLHRKMKPYIYGSTPLYSALHNAVDLFDLFPDSEEVDKYKYLFVFSDGAPSDYGDIYKLKSKFEKRSISVIGCYMSTSTGCSIKPKQLYGTVGSDWEEGARFLFDLSSMVPTDNVPRAIFINNGWDVDINKKETKLFLHINNPENMRSAVEVVKKAMSSQDSLLDLITHVSIERYIKSENDKFKPPKQEGKTCYANAAATVMHLALVRIHKREDGYPTFESLRREIIDKFGEQGADTMDVLQTFCPKYRLHCKAIDRKEALKAVSERRPVIARFELTDYEWIEFNNIFNREPKKILSEEDIHIYSRISARKISHAVVLTSYNSDSLCLMNSKGVEWGDGGFFRVKNADVVGLEFIDVFWKENDLSEPEKQQYRQHGLDIASKLVSSLKGIKNGIYSCPLCKITSKISEFHGSLSTAVCPECQGEFDSNDGKGNIIAMNIYLTSLNN
ncbi:uncharacterized protein LOC132760671 [Ruditapes philippinarum]|uniref:uncharacterized protein LOC132760671 n=1 Tax=Ruditapes philippinarum TaxID=129788 RepID=UPI00295B7722|nr:uncharacterized protein LOC132760671 [Ruditapes philippinarum]XP_060608686.1 uncharacterized protein LOC132760671 [Ruditapes philippinarum]